MQFYNTHGSDFHFNFLKNFLQVNYGREVLDGPECEFAKFYVSWNL